MLMEKEYNFDEKINPKRKNGIRILADQMARKFFGYEGNEPKNSLLSKQQIYDLILRQGDNNLSSIKSNETDNFNNPKIFTKDNKYNRKINQSQEMNSYNNTNINTKENNQNTIINTNFNTGTNLNTNSFNENYSNLNTKRIEIDESIYDDKKESDKNIEISIERISSYRLDEFTDDSFDNTNIMNNNIKKFGKIKKRTIYERSILERERRENIINKKRKEKVIKMFKELKPYPEMDPYSEEIIENKEYIPIHDRAAKIQNMKLFQNIMNEQRNKAKKLEQEKEEIKKYKRHYRKFDQDSWDQFVKRQKKWNKKVQYKKRAAIIIRDNEENENFYKPKINDKSRAIIEGIEEESKNYIDEVYIRLYSDYEEHEERQKFRNQQSLPSFRPKIIKCCSQKMFGFEQKRTDRCATNPIMGLKKNNKNKKSSILNKSMDNKNPEFFNDSCNNIENYYKNINRNDKFNKKYAKYINKSQQTNQQSKNNYSNLNCSQVSSGLINSKYIILDNQKLNNKGKSKNNSCVPFLPYNIKKMIENNCKDEEEKIEPVDKKNKIIEQQNVNKEKYHFNISLYNMEESKEKIKNEKYNESEINALEEGENFNDSKVSDKLNDIDINGNSAELKLQREKEREKEREELLMKLEKGQKIINKKEKESIDSEKSNKIENDIYKINIRDTTPLHVKENTVLASKDYSDFFDFPDFEEEI